jgi:carboxyl-terminal processing protease
MNARASIVTLLLALSLTLIVSTPGLAKEAAPPIVSATTEANITRVTAALLERSQFAHHPLDDQLANAFFERYLDALDAEHSLFVQTDVKQFSVHRATLARNTRSTGDAKVAHAIFARYKERLEQRVVFINDRLQHANFEFLEQSQFSLDRRQSPRPIDLAAARELWWQRLRVEYLQEKLAKKTPEEIAKVLRKRADRQLLAVKQMSRDGVLEIYLSALARVYDPHSDYLGREQLAEFAIAMKLSLFGIGARLRSEGRGPKILAVLPGGPAARSGLLSAGDRIVAVAQGSAEAVDVVNLPLSRAVALIRGPKGSVVKLTVVPVNAGDDAVRKIITLVRDEIHLEAQRATSKIIDMPNGQGAVLRLGVVTLPSFYADLSAGRGQSKSTTRATTDVAQLLEKLKTENVQGVVLDLRRNGGGSLAESINLTGLFIKQGPVVQTRGPAGDIEIDEDTDSGVTYDGPLVVLTSRFSASASEILAGALQDYGRAIIVGATSTYGKGTVQSLVPLAPIMDRSGLKYAYDPGALKVTIRKFYRPSGASTQLRGVVPDIVLPSLSNRSDAGESVLDNPLPWDTVPPANFAQVSVVRPYLAAVREESARRVAAGQGFAYLRAAIARLEQRLVSKKVSLNETVRRQELDEFKARKKAHDEAIQALGDPLPVTYEVTLRDAAQPGLPAPMVQAKSEAVLQAAIPDAASEGVLEQGLDADDAKTQKPPRDVVLIETQKIAADYVSLRNHQTVWRSAQTPANTAQQSARR